MTCGSEKDYTKAAVNLREEVASTGADQWRGLPSTPLLDPAETPSSIFQSHLKQ
jgi:hypothetical protein